MLAKNGLPVTAEERANRFAQTAAIIVLSGSNARQFAYHLERKLFDNGHAATVLEHSNDALASAIKNAGLLCLCIDTQPSTADIALDCNHFSIDEIYSDLKNRGVIR